MGKADISFIEQKKTKNHLKPRITQQQLQKFQNLPI